jgi:PRTRC genetic system protein A
VTDLAAIFAGLRCYHVATPAEPLPREAPGIAWIFAANGVWKRGVSETLSILLPVADYVDVAGVDARTLPGLAPLMPGVRWRDYPHRIPGQLLAAMLAHARKAATTTPSGLLTPIEQQYHITHEAGRLRVRVPPQDATAGRVRYELPDAPILLDLHSHHSMAAFFSGTDNRDDTGLGVSAVIGRIYDRPEIAVRLCCYGHTQRVPALTVFDGLGGCRDTYGARNADPEP